MGVPQGYKQTEVGVIPEGWEVSLVSESYAICNNLRFPLSEKVREEMQGLYPYYGPTKIQDYIDEYRVEGEYCLIGEDGDHFLKWSNSDMTILVSGQFNVNNHAHLVKGIKYETSWFYYYFRNRDITKYLTRQGAGRYKLTKASLEAIPFCAPPTKTEQTAIANALSDADAWIQSLTRLIAKKRRIKQGVMQNLLTGKKRIAGFVKDAGYKSTEIGILPKDWSVIKLQEFIDINSGDSPSKFIFFDEGVPYFKVEQLNSDSKYITETPYKIKSQKLISAGSIIFPKRGASILLNKIRILTHDSFMDTNLMTLTTKGGLHGEYLYYCLDYQGLSNIADTTSIPQINNKHITPFLIPFPPMVEEQTRIATILSDMDTEITQLETKLTKAKTLKQGMMQNLLTGKIRLVNPKECRDAAVSC